MTQKGWFFAPYSGQNNGLNDSGENTFSGDLVTGFVREVLQNSLDAARTADPVRVVFSLDELQREALEDIAGIRKYLDAGLALANHTVEERQREGIDVGSKQRDELAFFRNAVNVLSGDSVSVLGIHDYGTTGLTGEVFHERDLSQSSKWLALTRGGGVSVKDSGGSGGNHGIGHHAPFAISELNSCFYFSTIENSPSGPSSRFQGAIRLRTIQKRFFDDNETTIDQYGYFGDAGATEPVPLEGAEIPAWATSLRPNSNDVGTSVMVVQPVPIPEDDLWLQVAGATISNFYSAIRDNKLSVVVGGKYLLNSETLRSVWEQIIESGDYQGLVKAADRKDLDLERLDHVLTIHEPDESGSRDLGDLGELEWFLRKGDSVERKGIAISRGLGMYIGHSLPGLTLRSLRQFQNFSLFVSLKGLEASRVLAEMENPAHTEVSIDNVKNPAAKQEINRKYKKLRKLLLDLVGELIPPTTDEEFILEGLDRFFQLPFGSGEDEREPVSDRVTVGKVARIKRAEGTPTEVLDGSDSGLEPRKGEETKNYKPSGGDGFDTPDGEGGTKGTKKSGREVKDLRVAPVNGEECVRVVKFTPLDSSRKYLVLMRSGQRETEQLEFRLNKDKPWIRRLHIPSIAESKRATVRLEFHPEDLNFPMEGRLEP